MESIAYKTQRNLDHFELSTTFVTSTFASSKILNMRDFPSCFGENGVQIAADTTQNLVTCVYQCSLHTSSTFIITIHWSRSLMGQGLSVEINNPTTHSLSKLDIKSNLFSKKRGFKTLQMGSNSVHIVWDLSSAKFTSSPQPIQDYYFAVVVNQEFILVLGDMERQLHKKMNYSITSSKNTVFVSKTEHVFGKKLYSTTAQFCGKGQVHEVLIECDGDDPVLSIRIDGKMVMQVKRLQWKFRGNYTILIDGLPVEVYWDVYSWFFGKLMGNGVFLFQTCLSAEKLWGSAPLVKDLGHSCGLGFSLVVFAWKNE